MKAQLNPSPEDLTLLTLASRFDTEDKARAYLEAIQWPDGPICPHCGNAKEGRIWRLAANPAKKIRPGLLRCADCKKQFTVTVGTIFEDSHIPLSKWLTAWYLLNASKKGISALQIQRMLKIGSYRTALFMMHRIRFALKDLSPPPTKLKGTVEVDETYVGGKVHGSYGPRAGGKVPVFAMVERDGKARSQVVNCVTGNNLKRILHENVDTSATIMTDDFRPYRKATKEFEGHETVNHSAKEYVRGNVHTNTVEGYFSLLKRGIVGTFHSVSKQHLPLYLAEFDHRYNTRTQTDGERTVEGLGKVQGKRLMYRKPAA